MDLGQRHPVITTTTALCVVFQVSGPRVSHAGATPKTPPLGRFIAHGGRSQTQLILAREELGQRPVVAESGNNEECGPAPTRLTRGCLFFGTHALITYLFLVDLLPPRSLCYCIPLLEHACFLLVSYMSSVAICVLFGFFSFSHVISLRFSLVLDCYEQTKGQPNSLSYSPRGHLIPPS